MPNHAIPVVKIKELLPHKNAERLELTNIGGYQVVVGKGQFEAGQLAVYVPPDSVVSENQVFNFVWSIDNGGKPRALVPGEPIPEKYRRVTVKRLRKEYSEGLLMPLSDFPELTGAKEGDDVATILGITHYQPPEPESAPHNPYHNFEKGLRPKSLRGWWHWLLWKLHLGKDRATAGYGNEKAPPSYPPAYDVENIKKFPGLFDPEEEVVITEKVHGSNMRATYQKKMYVGSRNFWKGPKTDCIWRAALKSNEWLEEWHREHEGFTSYMEVVPSQGGYPYGATTEKPRVFIFDILNPDGQFEEVFNNYGLEGDMREHWVPVLFRGKFKDADLKALASGKSLIAPNQLREGIVIRPVKERSVHGLGRLQLKLVNPEFLLKDSQ